MLAELKNFFKEVPDKLFLEVYDLFAYGKGTKNYKATKLLTDLLEETGTSEAYLALLWDQKHPDRFFNRCSGSKAEILKMMAMYMSDLCVDRFRKNLYSSELVYSENKVKFLNLKVRLFEIYNCFFRSEIYFKSKEEDQVDYNDISKMNYG